MTSSSTYGEQVVQQFLSKLPDKQYFTIPNPRFNAANSAYVEPDFVVVSARLGVFVIEVKDWVKIHAATQQEITIETRDGERKVFPNPLITARSYSHSLANQCKTRAELLDPHTSSQRLSFPYMPIAVLPNIPRHVVDQLAKENIWPAHAVWSRDDLVTLTPETLLERVPRPFDLTTPLNKTTLDILRGVLNPHVIVHDAAGRDIGTLTVPQEQIISEPLKPQKAQQIALDDLMGREVVAMAEDLHIRLIRGVAGSGKSLVLQRRAQYLAEQHPDKRLLVLTFNKALADSLGERFSSQPNITVKTFHACCALLVTACDAKWPSPVQVQKWLDQYAAALETTGLSIDYAAQEFEWIGEMGITDRDTYLTINREGRGRSLPRAKREHLYDLYQHYQQDKKLKRERDWADISLWVRDLLDQHPLADPYDIALIDEAQDFAPSWLAVVQKTLKPGGVLFLCDDPTQSIWRSFSWRQRGIDVRGKTRVLRVPFRCTQQITEAAHAVLASDPLLSYGDDITQPDLLSYQLRQGHKPRLTACTTETAEIAFIDQQIKMWLAEGCTIAVLCHTKRIIKHWAHWREQGVQVITFNEMKGLEFDAVLIPHLHNSFDAAHTAAEPEALTEMRRRIFTAMTRARDHLLLSYQGRLPADLKPLLPYVLGA